MHRWTGRAYRLACRAYCDECILPSVGYIGEFEFVDDHRGGKLVVELNGR